MDCPVFHKYPFQEKGAEVKVFVQQRRKMYVLEKGSEYGYYGC
jgi:hypothetical protein